MTEMLQMENTTTILQVSQRDLEFTIRRIISEIQSEKPELEEKFPDTMTTTQAAKFLGKSTSWLYKMRSAVPCKSFGHKLIFDKKELEAWRDDQLRDEIRYKRKKVKISMRRRQTSE
jgi:hypothetical protein